MEFFKLRNEMLHFSSLWAYLQILNWQLKLAHDEYCGWVYHSFCDKEKNMDNRKMVIIY